MALLELADDLAAVCLLPLDEIPLELRLTDVSANKQPNT